MKDVITQQFDEKEMEYAGLISKVGNISINDGVVLTALSQNEILDVKGIMGICNLTQPEISLSINSLIEKGFVVSSIPEKFEGVEKTGKGRPRKIYSLVIDISEIIGIFEKEHAGRIEKGKEDIKRLKELVV